MKINEKTLLIFANSKPVDKEGYLGKRGEGLIAKCFHLFSQVHWLCSPPTQSIKTSRDDGSCWKEIFFSILKKEEENFWERSYSRVAPLSSVGWRQCDEKTTISIISWLTCSWSWDWRILLQYQFLWQPMLCTISWWPVHTWKLDESTDNLWVWLHAIHDSGATKTIRGTRQRLCDVSNEWYSSSSYHPTATTKSF